VTIIVALTIGCRVSLNLKFKRRAPQIFALQFCRSLPGGREAVREKFSLPPVNDTADGKFPSYNLPAIALADFTIAAPVFRRIAPVFF
jgi:hypothetical protein